MSSKYWWRRRLGKWNKSQQPYWENNCNKEAECIDVDARSAVSSLQTKGELIKETRHIAWPWAMLYVIMGEINFTSHDMKKLLKAAHSKSGLTIKLHVSDLVCFPCPNNDGACAWSRSMFFPQLEVIYIAHLFTQIDISVEFTDMISPDLLHILCEIPLSPRNFLTVSILPVSTKLI